MNETDVQREVHKMKQENNLEKDTGAVICKMTIKGSYWHDKCFPSLNDMLREAEKHPKAYARMKRDFTLITINAIRRDIGNYKVECKSRLDFTFGEPNKGQKRDFDNIVSAGRKIITDALVKSKVLEDDNPQYLEFGNNYFEYVSEPFITVEIIKVETPSES